MYQMIRRFRRDGAGAGMAEYGLPASLIALVVAGAATTFGQNTATLFSRIASYVATLPNSP